MSGTAFHPLKLGALTAAAATLPSSGLAQVATSVAAAQGAARRASGRVGPEY
ncbi:MAG: hypothetical protein ACREO0_08055 [Pseudoxanthomonas sp.]